MSAYRSYATLKFENDIGYSVSIFVIKVAQMYGDFLGFLKTSPFKRKLLWLLFRQLWDK